LKLRLFIFSASSSLAIFYQIMGSFRPLHPRNFQWITGDNTAGYIAQLFYLSDKWRFPLAANPTFGLDLSTSLIYTGPPLPLTLVQKLFRVDPSLQFIGIWLLAVLTLHIFLGVLLGKSLGLNSLQASLFGLLLVTPFLLFRFQFHFWLVSHFLLIWALWIVVRSCKKERVSTVEISFLLFTSYLVNSYILVMVILVLSYLLLKSQANSREILRHNKGRVLIPISILMVTYFTFDFRAQKATFLEGIRMNFTGEYTFYTSNLLALINPEVGYARDCTRGHCMFGDRKPPPHILENFSIFNWDFGGVQGNFEGYLYLGLGLVFLLLISLFLELRNLSQMRIRYLWSQYKVLFVYIFIISSYSITYKVSIGNLQLDLGDPKIVRWALSVFRASGRFMWIVAYVFLILTLLVLIKHLQKKKTLTLVLLGALLLQVIDVGPALRERQIELSRANLVSIPDLEKEDSYVSDWSKSKEALVLYPAGTTVGWPTMAYIAWKHGLDSGSFSSSRINYAELERFNERLKNMICDGNLPNSWLVAIVDDSISEFTDCERFSALKLLKSSNFYLIPSDGG